MATGVVGNFVPVAKVGSIPDGGMIAARVGDAEVLLARVGPNYYATANTCPHMGARLSEGFLTGRVLQCPRHGSRFDVTDGRVLRWTDWTGIMASASRLFRPPRPLATYRVKIEGEDILVTV